MTLVRSVISTWCHYQIGFVYSEVTYTICVSQSKTLAPRNLFWELRLKEGAGNCPPTGATSKINYSEGESSID